MTLAHKHWADVSGITIASSPADMGHISSPGCAGVIWNRQPLATFQSWINTLASDQLPSARVILRPDAVKEVISIICDSANMANCVERNRLTDDITALANIFSKVMRSPFLRVRLDAVTTNACHKFHTDAVTARLVCTYRGSGTQYGVSNGGGEPTHIFTVPTGAPILLRGKLWPEQPCSGLLHRSPPIEGSGETRLVLVLDPIFDVDQEV